MKSRTNVQANLRSQLSSPARKKELKKKTEEEEKEKN